MRHSNRRTTRLARAFSMLEIMLVIALITMLAGVVVYSMRGQTDKAKVAATKLKMKQLATFLDSYYANNSSYPETLEVLTEGPTPDMTKVPKDGWKVDFYYDPRGAAAGENFTLISAGPDKQHLTPDDINIWDVLEEE